MGKKNKNIAEFLWRVDKDHLETLRRAKYDANVTSLNAMITEIIELGFPLFCEKYKITPSTPKPVELKQEETTIENKDTFTIFDKAKDIKKIIKEKDLS